MTIEISVRRIDKATAKAVIVAKHYSGRLGIMWEAFGLFSGDRLCGVVCYGQPSAPIQKHAFTGRDFRLYELTRLVIDRGEDKNAASILISRSLQMLSERPCAVVSYADSMHGHCGIVYQATNWLYTGATKAHDCLYVVNGERLHAMTVIDRYKVTEPAKWAKENGIERIKPDAKHRYFMIIGNKTQRKKMLASLRYPVISEYPKTEKRLYDCGAPCSTITQPSPCMQLF